MKKIKIVFEKGGILTGYLNEKATPETVEAVWNALPTTSILKHTRWCGREVYAQIKTGAVPKRENHTDIVSKFDIGYWREEWDLTTGKTKEDSSETISLYYGPEKLEYAGGLTTLNVIGRIAWDDEEMLDRIGTRVWSEGFEQITIEKDDEEKL